VLYSSIHYTLVYRAHSPYLFTDARVENLGCEVNYVCGFRRVDTSDVKALRPDWGLETKNLPQP